VHFSYVFDQHIFSGGAMQTTVGHGALLTSCTIGSRTLIGQGAVIQEGCEIGHNCMIAAGAVLLPSKPAFSLKLSRLVQGNKSLQTYVDTVVPSKQLWAGNPAAYVRDVTEEEMAHFAKVRMLPSGMHVFC
jgi:carbonic anhydrase/acetyltransferase-like protein (isoleucine patch superfamily)